VLKNANLSGKTIALFGCGDSESYSDTFCDGMGII
jgi:flavodoxin I